MKFYKLCSLVMAFIFAIVGVIFLFFPIAPINFFNFISQIINFPVIKISEISFYNILAVAYMYLVTVLAVQMFRQPGEKIYSFLLAHGKFASSLLSILFFIFHGGYFIFFANFLIDGFIGIFVIFLRKLNTMDPKI